MKKPARLVPFAMLLLVVFALTLFAQEQKTGSVTGHVTVDGKPAKDITVIAAPLVTDPGKAMESMLNRSASLKATTDSDGRYKFEAVPAGKYKIAPFAPTLISNNPESAGEVTVSDAPTEGIDFALSLGGVITGKITDSDGRPVIGEKISLKPIGEPSSPSGRSVASAMTAMFGGSRMYATDDRGIYRIFGLKPGRYLVSAGGDDMMSAMFKFKPKRAQTFYPGVTEEAKAKQVIVTAGSEAAAIDIQFNAADKGFVVSGRVVEAEKGTPIPNTMVAYSKVRRPPSDNPGVEDLSKTAEDSIGSAMPGGMTTTNDKGEFRFESVAPGKYSIETAQIGALTGTGGNEFYGDSLTFEVTSANVDKLEVKVHRGASISGIVVVENSDGLESFGRLMLIASVSDQQTKSSSTGNAAVGADGAFRIGGLKAGKVSLRTFAMGAKQATVARVERNGSDVQNTLVIQTDEQVTGLRVVLATSNCVIQGHVAIQGGSLPPGVQLTAKARPLRASPTPPFDFFGGDSEDVDSNGNFVIEDLSPGTYEVEVSAQIPSQAGTRTVSTKQTVTVSSGSPAIVALVLDVSGKGSDK